MQNKLPKNILAVVLILALLGSVYFAYTKMYPKKKTATGSTDTSSYQINNNIYKSIANPKDFGGAISTDAAGFGRENPFADYK